MNFTLGAKTVESASQWGLHPNSDDVTISIEKYIKLLKSWRLLQALQQGGVKQWEHYSNSISDYKTIHDLAVDYFDDVI